MKGLKHKFQLKRNSFITTRIYAHSGSKQPLIMIDLIWKNGLFSVNREVKLVTIVFYRGYIGQGLLEKSGNLFVYY